MRALLRPAILACAALLCLGAAPNWNARITQTPEGGHRLGNPEAQVKVVAFESYTCPHCANFQLQSDGPLRLAYIPTGKVSFEVRHFVRDGVDLTAAMLTECVAPAKFFDAHRALFSNFKTWSPRMHSATKAQLDRWNALDRAAGRRAIASDLGFYELLAPQGLTRGQADKCLNDGALAKRLAEQTKADSEKYGIEGTPSFAINGTLLAATYEWALLRMQIEARL